MGLEWRVFSDSSKENFEEFKKKSNTEKRTDVYVLLPNNPEFGLKIRGGKKLELKVCSKRDSKGIENWTKVVKSKIAKGKDLKTEICNILTSFKQDDCVKVLQETELKFAVVNKVRTNVGSMERAELKIICTTEYPLNEEELEGNAQYFKSVCIEGYDKEVLLKEVKKYLETDLFCSESLGYNQFLSTYLK
jgi:DNA polymerase/3'-5' exonuclease PolX